MQLLAHPTPVTPTQFLQFRMKIINLKLERFRDRVEFSGNPSKYDVSVTLKKVQLEDEGTYNCYIMNPPDRHRGHGKIYLQVLMEGERLRGGPAHSQPATLQQGSWAPWEKLCPPEGWEPQRVLGGRHLFHSFQSLRTVSPRVLMMLSIMIMTLRILRTAFIYWTLTMSQL